MSGPGLRRQVLFTWRPAAPGLRREKLIMSYEVVCPGLRSQEIIRRQWVRLEEPEIIYEAMGPGLWPEEPGFN